MSGLEDLQHWPLQNGTFRFRVIIITIIIIIIVYR